MIKYKQFNVNYSSTETEINDFLKETKITKNLIIFVGSEAGRFIILYENNECYANKEQK
jgi:hypothetical protein